MEERKGDWMQTRHGRVFWPLDPRPNEVHLDDIAWSLAHQNRFAGHAMASYSVGQHCVLVAGLARDLGGSPMEVLAALFHDASEAYVVDVPRPIKPFLVGYKDIEKRVQEAIALRFGMPVGCFDWPLVHHCDGAILAAEARDIMVPPPRAWETLPAAPPERIVVWSPTQAEHEFLAMADALFSNSTNDHGPACPAMCCVKRRAAERAGGAK